MANPPSSRTLLFGAPMLKAPRARHLYETPMAGCYADDTPTEVWSIILGHVVKANVSDVCLAGPVIPPVPDRTHRKKPDPVIVARHATDYYRRIFNVLLRWRTIPFLEAAIPWKLLYGNLVTFFDHYIRTRDINKWLDVKPRYWSVADVPRRWCFLVLAKFVRGPENDPARSVILAYHGNRPDLFTSERYDDLPDDDDSTQGWRYYNLSKTFTRRRGLSGSQDHRSLAYVSAKVEYCTKLNTDRAKFLSGRDNLETQRSAGSPDIVETAQITKSVKLLTTGEYWTGYIEPHVLKRLLLRQHVLALPSSRHSALKLAIGECVTRVEDLLRQRRKRRRSNRNKLAMRKRRCLDRAGASVDVDPVPG